jgi:hypothetical protein
MMEESMSGLGRRSFLLGLCGAGLLAGCNFPTAMYFLMPEAQEPAEYKRLASDDKKKEVRVVLWTYSSLDMRAEFIQADRLLTDLLAKHINKMSQENQEKVTVVSPRKVEDYKNTHPEWKSYREEEIGHYFKANYVVSLEINQLSLYEPNAHEQLYSGRAHILVKVVDVENPDDSPHPTEFTDRYPTELRGGIDTLDIPVMVFRQKFLEHVAKRLSYYFVNHQKRERVMVMDE